MITHKCNLNCAYCYETHKSDKQMPLELAKTLIEDEFDRVAHSEKFSDLLIDFIGGEPLLRFDMIKEVAEWVWSRTWPVGYMHFATTNGTLLDDKMKAWFETHRRQFCLSLSLDGSPETQETNRRGSFARIDLEFFRRLWPEQQVKMTLSKETLPTLASDVLYLHKAGFLVHFNPANGIDWNEEDASVYAVQMDILAGFYLEHPEIEPAGAFTPALTALLERNPPPRKYCGTGNYMVTYDVDGTPYPCHLFTPIVMGDNRSEDLKRFDFSGSEDIVDPECEQCPVLRLCPTCYGFNYKYRGHIALRDKGYCKMFKLQLGAASRFQLDRLMKKGGPHSRDEMLEAKSLVYVGDIFQSSAAAE